MRVAASVVQARRSSLAVLLQDHRYLPLAEVCTRLKISPATARRDLLALARSKEITRTYGGALSSFDARYASFADRRRVEAGAKARIAEKARQFLPDRQKSICFFDSGTTVFALAEALSRRPVAGLVAVTNSLPVAEILGRGHEVHLLGGRFLQRQSILLGPEARRSALRWKFDLVFLGAEGVSRRGIWASEPEVARFQEALIRQAGRVLVCAHAAKLGRETGAFLTPWQKKIELVTDAPARLRTTHQLPC